MLLTLASHVDSGFDHTSTSSPRAIACIHPVCTPPRENLAGGPRLADPQLDAVSPLGEREYNATREALALGTKACCAFIATFGMIIVAYSAVSFFMPATMHRHCEEQLIDNGVILEANEGEIGRYECNFLYALSPFPSIPEQLKCRRVHYCIGLKDAARSAVPICGHAYHFILDKDINKTFTGLRPMFEMLNDYWKKSVGMCVTDWVAAEEDAEFEVEEAEEEAGSIAGEAEEEVGLESVPSAAADALRRQPRPVRTKLRPAASSLTLIASIVLCFGALLAMAPARGYARLRVCPVPQAPLLNVDASVDMEELTALVAFQENEVDL